MPAKSTLAGADCNCEKNSVWIGVKYKCHLLLVGSSVLLVREVLFIFLAEKVWIGGTLNEAFF